jgi:hypothetical protein
MELKKLLTSAIAAGSLILAAACGDDGENGDPDGGGECTANVPSCDLADLITQPSEGCLAEAGEQDSTDYRVTSIVIPPAVAAKGFDLDCFQTTPTDAFGCMKADRGAGVDNALAQITELLAALDVALNDNLAEGIGSGYDGEIRFRIMVRGIDNVTDDSCVVVELETYNPGTTLFEPAAVPVAAVIEAGVVKTSLTSLPLVIPLGTELLQVNVDRARVELPLNEVGGITGGIIGGHVIWDDGSTGDLESLVRSVIESLGEDATIDFNTAASIIVNQLDMYVDEVSEDGCDCQAISVGIEIGAEAEDEPPPV